MNSETISEIDERFCQAYVANQFNGTAAHLAINEHVERSTAASRACERLRRPEIKRRISEICEEKKRQLNLDAGTVLHELLLIATGNPFAALVDSSGSIDPAKLADAPPEIQRLVDGIETTKTKNRGDGGETERVKIRFHSKLRALELLGKNPALRLFVEQAEQGAPGDFKNGIKFELVGVEPKKEGQA